MAVNWRVGAVIACVAVACSFDPTSPGAGGDDVDGVDASTTPATDAARPGDGSPAADASGPGPTPDAPLAGAFCDPSDPSLAACWEFEPGADPTRLVDGSGYGNHGSIAGAGTMPGIAGEALVLNDDTVVAVPDSISLDADIALTIEGWVRLSESPAPRAWLVDNQAQYGLSIDAAGFVRCDGANSPAVSATPVLVGAWTHVACTFDGGAQRMRIYINGALSDDDIARDSLRSNPPTDLVVGGDSPCNAAPCNEGLRGAVDQLRVWRSVRSAAELCAAAGHTDCPP